MVSMKVTHERAIWAGQEKTHWKLDPTEGPHRMRIRLKRAAIHLPFLTPVSVHSVQEEAPTNGFISAGKKLKGIVSIYSFKMLFHDKELKI